MAMQTTAELLDLSVYAHGLCPGGPIPEGGTCTHCNMSAETLAAITRCAAVLERIARMGHVQGDGMTAAASRAQRWARRALAREVRP